MQDRKRTFLLTLLALSVALGCNTTSGLQPSPTETPLMVNWEKFGGQGVELWLPDSFEGGNVEENVDNMVEKIRNLGPGYERWVQVIEQYSSHICLWAFDTKIVDKQFLTNVIVSKDEVFSMRDVELYMDLLIEQLPEEFDVIERRQISLNHLQAGRVIVEANVYGVDATQVNYVILYDTTTWVTTYATTTDVFNERLPDFERSALTINILP